MPTKKQIKKFIPFALYNIDALADCLTEMRRNGFMFEKMNDFGFLYFKQVKPRDDLEYVILTSKFPAPWLRIKNWDIDFLRKCDKQFDKDFHRVFTVSSMKEYKYHIYEINAACGSVYGKDIDRMKKQRKKRLLKINIYRTFSYAIFVVMVLCLLLLFFY